VNPRYAPNLLADPLPRRRALLLAGAIALALSAWGWQDTRPRLASGLPAVAVPTDRASLAAQKRAGEMRNALDRPWGELFDALETASTPRVALLALEPDLVAAQIRLVAEARDEQAMLAWVEALQQQPVLGGVRLQSQELREDDDAEEPPVRFTVELTWPRP
jgi:Tfp pilus assembly protein PilN